VIDTNEILSLLKAEYGIVSNTISPAVGGFSAKAYHVKSNDNVKYFVKAYDKSLPTTRFFVDRIDIYMPVLDKLRVLPTLREKILTPVLTLNGAYKVETDNHVFVLFLFVNGIMPGVKGMTSSQTAELAEILACLHDAGDNIELDKNGLAEDISLPFCEQLASFLENQKPNSDALYELIFPHIDMLRSAIQKCLTLRDTVRAGCSSLVLCHGDAHGNNVIQSERLVLVDWEDLRIAPVEADLFIHAWHTHGETLLEAYSAARGGYKINRDLLNFYVLRRRIEDAWVDIQRLTEETPDEAETEKSLYYIRQSIEEISRIL
jgi:Ser/Thr protein kinase RdoA (MazF antagonist)